MRTVGDTDCCSNKWSPTTKLCPTRKGSSVGAFLTSKPRKLREIGFSTKWKIKPNLAVAFFKTFFFVELQKLPSSLLWFISS